MVEVKSGEELLREFFENLDKLTDVDEMLTKRLKELYRIGKLTETSIKNMLDELIKEGTKYED